MNTINFTQVGGFPLTTNILGKLQTAFSLFNALGALAGDKAIISGCTIAGSNVSDGVVYVNGEVFEFRGGVVQTTVLIKEDSESLTFGNNNSYPVVKTRYVTFGTGVGQMNWADFKKPVETKTTPDNLTLRLEALEKKAAVFTAGGGMVLWNKPANEIPEGWQEVVDWRGRIPAGLDVTQTEFNTMGKVGGAKNKKLSVGELPKHNFFTFSPSSTATSNSTVDSNTYPVADSDGTGWGNETYRIRRSSTKPTLGKSSDVGNDEQFSLLNPYRVVLFIEYVG